MDGLIIPVGFQSIRTLPDGRHVRCEVEEITSPAQSPKSVSILFSVSQVCADGTIASKVVACSPQEAWFNFLGLDFNGGLHRFLERCGHHRCNGMLLFGLGVSAVQSLFHLICKTYVRERDVSGTKDGLAEEDEEERNDMFMSPFAACEKRQSRGFSAAINRHTHTFLTWLETKRPQPPLKHSVLGREDALPLLRVVHL